MRHLQDLHVLVLGLGQSGLAMVRWCAGHGAQVRAWDSRESPPQLDALRAELPAVPVATGTLAAADLAGVQLVLKSPGLAPNDPSIAALLDAARATGIAVAGELDLFARALADLKNERGYAPKVIAVTGTNGKTTTTALASLLIARCGLRVASAGNIGPTMLDTLAAALALEPPVATDAPAAGESRLQVESPSAVQDPGDAGDSDDTSDAPALDADGALPLAVSVVSADEGDDSAPAPLVPPPAVPVFEHLPEVWVLELSSFQLDGVRGFEPSAAAVLNVSQDHLDWHGSMDAYVAAKAQVFGETATMVINRDDPVVEAMVPPPQVLKSTHKGARSKTVARRVMRFGLDAPRAPGDFGLVVENGMAWLVRALEADPTIKRRKDEAADDEIHLQRLMPADALHIRGRHNAANALAALALASAIGCPLAPMLHGLREYRGEPHRVEPVGSVGGIEAFDDSKGTNVGATVAALNGLGADKAPARLVVILGGDGKGQDFAPLVAPVARHARAVALIGRDAPVLSQVLAATGVPQQIHVTLEAATAWCFGQAQPGDAVLLSPACASLDMFRHYGHRAEVFVAAVTALAAEHGEAL